MKPFFLPQAHLGLGKERISLQMRLNKGSCPLIPIPRFLILNAKAMGCLYKPKNVVATTSRREDTMKKNSAPSYPTTLLAAMCTLLLASVPAFAAEGWEELPPLVFQEYVDVETVIAPNPYSEQSNDFLVVTKYEEGPKAGAAGGKAREGARNALKSLNVYLVTGLIILDGGGTGIPYHTSLIVSLQIGGGKDPGKTVQQWVLSDSDGDGKLDQARFQKIITGSGGNTLRSGPVDVPQDRVGNYQTYYETASRELNSKAEISMSD